MHFELNIYSRPKPRFTIQFYSSAIHEIALSVSCLRNACLYRLTRAGRSFVRRSHTNLILMRKEDFTTATPRISNGFKVSEAQSLINNDPELKRQVGQLLGGDGDNIPELTLDTLLGLQAGRSVNPWVEGARIRLPKKEDAIRFAIRKNRDGKLYIGGTLVVEFIDEAGRTLKEAPFFINTFRREADRCRVFDANGNPTGNIVQPLAGSFNVSPAAQAAETLGEVYSALETYLSNGVGIVRSEEYLGRDTYGKIRTMHLISLMKG